MLRFSVLASGSAGNSLWVASESSSALIDCGLSARQITNRLEAIEWSPRDLQGLVVTHEHADHAGGSGVVSRRFHIPVHATAGTQRAAARALGEVPELRTIKAGEMFSIGDLRFEPFSQPHDASEPIGLSIHAGAAKLTLITDLGYITHLVRDKVRGSNALILESNHDLKMLQEGAYPWALKQRISSRRGHLSNNDSAAFLAQAADDSMRYVVMAHLSEKNNDVHLVGDLHQRALNGLRTQLRIARQDCPTEVFII